MIVETPGVRRLDDEHTTGAQQRIHALRDRDRVLYMFDQLQHDDRVVGAPAGIELFDSSDVGTAAASPTLLGRDGIEIDTFELPFARTELGEQREKAAVPASDVENAA